MKPYRIFVYVLVKDIESAEKRVQYLRMLGVDPFAQPYRDFNTNEEPPQMLKDFARWVNDKAIFNTVEKFSEYRKSVRKAI